MVWHLEIIEERRVTKKMRELKPIACRPRGRRKMRWEGDVKRDL
jgi:hypothetical protein